MKSSGGGVIAQKYPLDQADVFTISWSKRFQEWLKRKEILTFGQLRAHLSQIDEMPGLGPQGRSVLRCRMSNQIYCRCGSPFILTDTGMVCEEAGPECSRIQRYEDRNLIRKAFPERVSK